MKEDIKATGEIEFKLNGEVVQIVKNLVVSVGRDFIASRMLNTTPAIMSHMAVGTGTTAAVAGDTALETELARVALSSSTVANNVVTYVANFPAGTGTGAITEAGILNAASAGTMLCRSTFAAINKGSDDSLTATWTITISV